MYTKAPVLYIMQKPGEDVAQVFGECLETEIKTIYTENNIMKHMVLTDKKTTRRPRSAGCVIVRLVRTRLRITATLPKIQGRST